MRATPSRKPCVTAANEALPLRLKSFVPSSHTTVRTPDSAMTSRSSRSSPAHGHQEQDANRRGLNDFIRNSRLFDAVLDFDAATHDQATGMLRPEMVPDSTIGAAGDGLHPNRAGYLAMGLSVDPAAVLGS
jgi:hypothetical protein